MRSSKPPLPLSQPSALPLVSRRTCSGCRDLQRREHLLQARRAERAALRAEAVQRRDAYRQLKQQFAAHAVRYSALRAAERPAPAPAAVSDYEAMLGLRAPP